MLFAIHNTISGAYLGAYTATDDGAALDAMARDAGYVDYAEAERVAPSNPGEIIVVAAYDRDHLNTAIPPVTSDSVGDSGAQAERQAFADGFNRVLEVLRAEYLPEHEALTPAEIDAAVQLGGAAWDEFCLQQGNVDRTINWLRSEIQ